MGSSRVTNLIKNSVLFCEIPSRFKCQSQMFSIPAHSNRSAFSTHDRYDIDVGGNSKFTIGDILKKWTQKFKKSHISEPTESAEYIVAHVLGTKKVSDIYRSQKKILLPGVLQQIDNLCEKRLQRMPVQYIIEEWDFRDLTLKMSRPVFIPRPETEILIDIALNEIDFKRTDKVLELCCGSGAISLAMLKARSKLQAIAVDKSADACRLTKENAKMNHVSDRLEVLQADIAKNFHLEMKLFDVIISNPPYVPTKDMDYLQPEIALYEDLDAFDGGNDGLTVIKSILGICASLLNYGGKLFLEVDPSHPALIKSRLQENHRLGLKFSRSFQDFSNKERFVEIIKQK